MKTRMQIPSSSHLTPPSWTFLLVALGVLALSLSVQAQKKPKPQPQITPLCVTFADDSADAMQSDGFGGYCEDGITGGVVANFDSDGRFHFHSGNPGTSLRVVNIDTSHFGLSEEDFSNLDFPAGGPGGEGNFEPSEYQVRLSINGPDCNTPFKDLRTLTVGESTEIGMVITILTPTLSQPNWRKQTEWHVVFGDWPADGECAARFVKYPCDNGATATVTRIDATTWTLATPTTELVCLLENAPVSKTDPDPFKLRARILFPFQMTISLKP